MVSITWLGHSTFEFRLASGEVLIADPWISGNPKYPANHVIERCDVILVTHGHFDHTTDLIALAQKHKPAIVCNYEIGVWLGSKGVEARGMNKGGTQQVGPISVTMTHAVHSSSMQDESGNLIYGGEPAGFVIQLPDGRSIYLAGDTNVFSDMALIEELYKPDLCMLPIGDLYTMGPREAALACQLLKARQVIGMHWGTFPPLTGTPEKLAELAPAGTQVIAMQPGETISW